jgi:antirestriction protein ArdC
MSRAPARRSTGDRATLYSEITDRIIAELEAGRLPWVQPWGTDQARTAVGLPRNAGSGRPYSGINVLILWGAVIERGYSGQGWLTFRQAKALGGAVRKGERGTTVVYADKFVPEDERRRASEKGEDPQAIPFLKRFTVFNTDPARRPTAPRLCSVSARPTDEHGATTCPRTSPTTCAARRSSGPEASSSATLHTRKS